MSDESSQPPPPSRPPLPPGMPPPPGYYQAQVPPPPERGVTVGDGARLTVGVFLACAVGMLLFCIFLLVGCGALLGGA